MRYAPLQLVDHLGLEIQFVNKHFVIRKLRRHMRSFTKLTLVLSCTRCDSTGYHDIADENIAGCVHHPPVPDSPHLFLLVIHCIPPIISSIYPSSGLEVVRLPEQAAGSTALWSPKC